MKETIVWAVGHDDGYEGYRLPMGIFYTEKEARQFLTDWNRSHAPYTYNPEDHFGFFCEEVTLFGSPLSTP